MFKQYFMNKRTQHIVHMNHLHTNYTVHKRYWNFWLNKDKKEEICPSPMTNTVVVEDTFNFKK